MVEVLQAKLGGRYEIRERIGAGGMARVFKALDVNLDRWVAVKILHDHLVDDPSFKERFTREAKFVASLNHPNIVQIYDYNSFERDGVPVYYMVMPLIKGPTLRAIIDSHARNGRPLPHAQALKLVLDLCDALGYAHEQGMAHRDIKPGNVMMDSSGRTILTDFGIARMITAPRLTQDSVATGTPAYMSPEQIEGEAGDSRSDLYSLGIMLFEMLTGNLPYKDEGGLSLVLKHLHAPVPRYSSVTGTSDPQMDLLFERALAKNPSDRFQTAEDFARTLRQLPLANIAPDSTVLITPTPIRQEALNTPALRAMSTAQTGQTRQLNRRTYSIMAVMLGIAGVIFLFALWQQQTQSGNTPAEEQPADIPAILPNSDVNQQAFTTRFEPDEPDIALWTEGDDRGIERVFDLDRGLYLLTNAQPDTAATSLVQGELPYGNVTITLVGRLNEGSAPEAAYGIVFRYQDNDNYNVFAIDGSGRYSIWTRQNGEWRELRNADERWTPSEFVAPLGEENRLRVSISNENLVAFINNQPIVRLQEATFSTGAVGIYLASPQDGIAIAAIDTYEVYPVIPSMTEPGQMG
jgi:serine/threonine protein kinase